MNERTARVHSISLVLLVLALFLIACRDEQSKYHLTVLWQIAAATDVFPGFKQVDVWENKKNGRAILSLYYTSSANYDEVKSFYSKKLIANGWQLFPKESRRGILYFQDENALVFRKGEYQIAILRGSLDERPTTRNFAITYVWERP